MIAQFHGNKCLGNVFIHVDVDIRIVYIFGNINIAKIGHTLVFPPLRTLVRYLHGYRGECRERVAEFGIVVLVDGEILEIKVE